MSRQKPQFKIDLDHMAMVKQQLENGCRYVGTRGTSPLSSQFWDEGDTHEQGSTRDHA